MELVTALFTTATAGAEAVGSGLLGAVGLGSAAAETGAAAAAANTGLAAQGLQGYLTAGQMLMQAGAGVGAIASANQSEKAANIQAKAEALSIQRDYLIKTGAARVAFAGSGVQIGSGSEAGVESSLSEQASLQERLAMAGGKAKAEAAQTAGIMGALSAGAGMLKTGADYSISLAKRGLPA
jgi:hypothetical protein